MTISSEIRKAGPFTGNGLTTQFPFSFKVFKAEDLLVVRADATGAESTLTLGTHYSVTLNANQTANPGGTVTLPAALALHHRLVITSDVANLQPVDLTNQGAFYPRVINDALDRHTIQIQQLAEGLDRAVQVPVTSDTDPDELVRNLYDFDNRYLGAKSQAPATDNHGRPLQDGATFWDLPANQMFTWNGTSWRPTYLIGNTVRSVVTATSGQTSLTTPTYLTGSNTLDVFVNGVKQVLGVDYTETSQNSISMTSPLSEGARVELIAQQAFQVDELRSDLASDAAGKGAALVAVKQAGTGSVVRTAQDKMREVVSAFDFMTPAEIAGVLSRTPTIDVSSKIQAAFSASRDGELLIPGGEYLVNSDVQLLLKGHAPNEGAFRIEATGAFFVGTGRVVLNSCKRVQINGLDMANMDLVFRGCWWSQFSNMRFRRLHLGPAAGNVFSDNYWIQFHQCQFQSVLTDPAAAGPSNEFSFEACSMRGNTGQGFSAAAAVAFEFNANKNCQSWKFNNGDISYHSSAIYAVGAGNAAGDIELTFNGTYFDSIMPVATDRTRTRIREVNCHHANGTVGSGSFSAMTCRTLDQFRADRAFKSDGWTGINLVANGDFRDRMNVWVGGSGFPLGNSNSATVTRIAGGFFGNALNINQALTTANNIRFRAKPLPYAGRVTSTIILRNADVGEKNMTLSVPGALSPPIQIVDTEWRVFTVTTTAILAAGSVNDIQVLTNDGTAYNVDVGYVAITLGEGSPLALSSPGYPVINHQETWDAPSVAAGTQITQTFVVPGVQQGDFVMASYSGNFGALDVSAHASNNDQVTLKLRNDTAAAIDLSSAVWRFRIFKSGYA